MEKGKLACILLIIILAGCAATQHAILDTPKRLEDALIKDPVRRTYSISRIAEAMSGGIVAGMIIATAGLPFIVPALVAGTLTEFIYYEYIAEPAGWTGYYWERYRDDEPFEYP